MKAGDEVFVDVSDGPTTVILSGKYIGTGSVNGSEVAIIELDKPLHPVDGYGKVDIIASATEWVFPKPTGI